MKNIWLLICAVSITCCNQKSENQNQTVSEIALPFYNEPTFTPEWIKETDEGFDETGFKTISRAALERDAREETTENLDDVGDVVNKADDDLTRMVKNILKSSCNVSKNCCSVNYFQYVKNSKMYESKISNDHGTVRKTIENKVCQKRNR